MCCNTLLSQHVPGSLQRLLLWLLRCSFLIKKNSSFSPSMFCACPLRCWVFFGFLCLFESSAVLFQREDLFQWFTDNIRFTQPPQTFLPCQSPRLPVMKKYTKDSFCCVSFLPDPHLPRCLNFFDHENKCQAGIKLTELELKPAGERERQTDRQTRSAAYSRLNASQFTAQAQVPGGPGTSVPYLTQSLQS